MTVIIKRRTTHLAYSFILLTQILLAFAVIATPAQAQTPVGHWRFDDGSGTKAADSSENGHTATLANGISWVKGPIGDAVSANELRKQYVIIPAIDLSGTQAVTVTLWANRTYSTAGAHVLFEATSNYTTSTTGLGFFPDDITCNGIQAAIRGNVGYSANCYSQPSSGVWHHLAVVFDKKQTAGDEIQFYVDGLLQTVNRSLYASTNTNNFANNPFYLFSRAGMTDFNSGMIDDLRIYDSALTAQQIQQIYNSAGLGSVAGTSGSTSIATGRQQQFTAAAADSITVTGSDLDIKQNATGGSGNIPVMKSTFYGVADATTDSTCAMTSLSHNLVCSDAPFSRCPTGKTVSVNGALVGVAPAPTFPLSLTTTITSCTNSSTAVLASPSTHATGRVTAIWGTDNYASIQSAVRSSASYNTCLVFPPGSFLVHGSVENQIMVPGNSCIIQSPGNNLYLVGVNGYDFSNDPSGHDAFGFFRLVDGQNHFYFEFDGNVFGENTAKAFRYGILTPNNIIKSFGNLGNSYVTITGSGWIRNQYGYLAAGYKGGVSGLGQNWYVTNLNSSWVATGINVNIDHSVFSNLYSEYGNGMEVAGDLDVQVLNNHCDHCSGGTIYSIGGDTTPGVSCTKYIVTGNTVTNPDPLNTQSMTLANCLVGAIVSGNSFEISSFNSIGLTVTNSNIGTRPHNNQIIGNEFICNNGNTAILLEQTDHDVLAGNNIHTRAGGRNCGAGVAAYGFGGHTIQNNVITANVGVTLFNGAIPTKLANNTITGKVPYSITNSPITPDSIVTAAGSTNGPPE